MLDLHAVILEDLENIVCQPLSWDKLRGKTVLITGAGGMIASYLVYTLLYLNETRAASIRVLALVRNKDKALAHFGPIAERQDFQLLVQDVCAPLPDCGPVHYIIHAASQASPRQFTADPVGTIRANTVGTATMLDEAVKRRSEGFLLLSTREIYGVQTGNKEYAREQDYGVTDPTAVRSCYPESKRLAETLCASYASQYHVPAKVARIAHTYGPGITLGDGRVVGDFIRDVIQHKNIVMNSDGSAILGLTYLSDLITGLFLVLLNAPHFVYNVSSMDGILSVGDFAKVLTGLFPERNLQVQFQSISVQEKAGYLSHKIALLDSEAIMKEGWLPQVSIESGFRRTVRFYEK